MIDDGYWMIEEGGSGLPFSIILNPLVTDEICTL